MGDAADPKIRLLKAEDLSRALELSTEAGWNQTLNDWEFFHQNAYNYAIDDSEGELVATTVAWDVAPRLSWIAMVLVTKACRGRGYARDLMQHAMAQAELRGRALALDASELGEPVYERLGFGIGEEIGRWRLEKYASAPVHAEMLPLRESDLDTVADLDFRVSGLSRASMLQEWLRRSPELAWGYRGPGGDLEGFVLGREGRTTHQIGPLISLNLNVAQALLEKALGTIGGPAYVDVPLGQRDFNDWLQRRGFKSERGFKRMSRPIGAINTDWSRTFAIAGPDVG